jgi:hypothetical protein
VLKWLGLVIVFYTGHVGYLLPFLFHGAGVAQFINNIKNGVVNIYVINIEMFIMFIGAKYVVFF